MTLTVVVGSSGSGKTTFLNDVHTENKCTYIRQYHNLRPYIKVNSIPNFDPSALPYWDIYLKENPNVKIGGLMAGETTAGLSGGQRKLLLFELIYQRTKASSDLLICLDEPFAGVTDDFMPFIVGRLKEMSANNNILLVTNDHIATLTGMGDNTITVSAIDRATVKVNAKESVDRETCLMAVSKGTDFEHTTSSADLKFFFDVELFSNGALGGVAGFTTFAMTLFVISYNNSSSFKGAYIDDLGLAHPASLGSEALVLVAIQIIAYFCINPYLLALVDWRNFMTEEAEALMHCSIRMNKTLKTILTLTILLIISCIAFGCLNTAITTMSDLKYFVAMLFDSASMTFPFLCFGLYTKLPFEAVQILGSFPFLMMIFFSTTFSPGAGLEGVKFLRYLFARFYFWCMIPGYGASMEDCPAENRLVLYTVLSGCLGLALFLIAMGVLGHVQKSKNKGRVQARQVAESSTDFKALQAEMYPASPAADIESGSKLLIKPARGPVA